MYDYILFDFDGTVFDTLEGITKSVRYALNKQGLDAPLSQLRCFAGPPLVDKFMEEYGFSKQQAEKATADFRERYSPIGLYECRVFPGIRELLEKLRARGKKIALATSKPQPLAEELLERAGMLGYFDAVCGGQLGGNSEKAFVVDTVIKMLSAPKQLCVLVGDTKYDVEGAHKCKIPCIGVSYGYAAQGELEQACADYIAADMTQLESLLLR